MLTGRRIALVAALGAFIVVTAACAKGTSGAPSDATTSTATSPTQKDDGAGSVTVEVTWVTPDHLADDEKLRAVADKHNGEDVVLLHVKMNTHSASLSKYDLAKISSLDTGGGPEAAIESVTISDDQHHAEAVLVFKRPSRSSMATLIVRDVGGMPERTLRWSPPPS